jgi:uracil-DNA glycosylase family 4
VCCIPWTNTVYKDGFSPAVRPPSKEEATACRDHLVELVNICNPKVVILLGKAAEESFPFDKETFPIPLTSLRHPSYILRKGGENSLEFKRFLDSFEAILTLADIPHVNPFQPAVL